MFNLIAICSFTNKVGLTKSCTHPGPDREAGTTGPSPIPTQAQTEGLELPGQVPYPPRPRQRGWNYRAKSHTHPGTDREAGTTGPSPIPTQAQTERLELPGQVPYPPRHRQRGWNYRAKSHTHPGPDREAGTTGPSPIPTQERLELLGKSNIHPSQDTCICNYRYNLTNHSNP